MEIVYVYQRKRKNFGRQSYFKDRPAEMTADVVTDPDYMSNYLVKNPVHTGIQCAPDMSEHDANTESKVLANKGVLHKEGGWPKDVDPTDVEHTLRFRKKIEKDEEYTKTVKVLAEAVEHCIKQNNAIDIYEEYFVNEVEDGVMEPPSAKTLNVYRDPNPVKRSVNCLAWYPDDGHKIAMAYSGLQFQQTPSNVSLESYIWDVENPNTPDQTILPSSPLVCLKYNPKDPHILVGGSYNGLLSYWDTRKGPYPVDSTSIEKSHRDPVFSVAWVQSKTGSEFFSTSTDGQVLWWDIRKLSDPTDSMILDPEKNGTSVGGTVLDFEPTMPTKFMVGSESGAAFLCNKKAKNPSERIQHTYLGHHGPIYALQRNPFFPKNFLTIGDWGARVWSEDVRSPIMSTKYQRSYLTDGCWSPTRPSVFCTAKMDGTLDIWDFIFKQNDPTLTMQVCNAPIHTAKIQEHGKMVAVGDRDGTTTLIELSESLSKLQANEKSIFSQMLEREAKREKTLETSAREKRLKAQAQQKKPTSASKRANTEQMEEAVKQAEADFFKAIQAPAK